MLRPCAQLALLPLLLSLSQAAAEGLLEAAKASGPRTIEIGVGIHARILHVSRSAGSDKTGDGSADRPFATVTRALEAAAAASDSDSYAIKVQAGVYSGREIRLKEHVDLFGGFGPRWERDIHRFPAVLDGGEQHRVMIGANHSRVDGFVIRNGMVRGRGAGILCDGSSPRLTNNVFTGNLTLAPSGWNPRELHEMANDGGAIAVANGGAPVIEHNLFFRNGTEAGRGAAVAYNSRSGGSLMYNVFLENTAGWRDPKRSSDGGAVSVFEWSRPEITGNVFVGNRAIASNDAGALFVALWSSPRIQGNIFVGNYGDDDAGALFIGGQEHRYSKPLDPFPSADQFDVHVVGNVFAGNANRSVNSGAFRITMESRALVGNNVIADNFGGAYFQRSEIRAFNNTIVNNTRFVETKEGLAAGILANNILWGELLVQAPVALTYNNVRGGHPGEGNINQPPGFVDDALALAVAGAVYQPDRFVTEIRIERRLPQPDELAGRVLRVGNKWSVIRSSTAGTIAVWGDFSEERSVFVTPTHRLADGSPCIDAGSNRNAMPFDIVGVKRPVLSLRSRAVDMGESVKLQYRAEFFNFLNRPQFGAANRTPTSATFGIIDGQQNTPRRIQMGLRLTW